MSDLDQFKPKTNPISETKSINYYSIFENYQSNPVQRSSSLNSLKRYKNIRSSNISDDERSVRSMTDGIESKSQSQIELPFEVVKVINQLERHSLHSNVRRDSFRSRSGTKNFVLNPIFDELETEVDDDVFTKNTESVENVETQTHESGLRLKPPNTVDNIETVFTDLKDLEDGKMSNIHPNPLRRSKSLKSNQFSSLW